MDSFDLPELALIQVLNHLPAQDQLNARLVCRYWKLITDNFAQRDELVLFFKFYPRPVYWFHDGREVDLGNAFLVNKPRCLKSEFFLRFFRRVHRLMIVHKVNTPSKQFIEHIQVSLLELKHLQFNSIGSKSSFSGLRKLPYKTNFQLANLRTFYSQFDDMPLGLHCPRLNELYVYAHLKIDETMDEQTRLCIQNLRFLLVQQLTYPPDFEFSNLEVFYFNNPSPAISLRNFPRLVELHYFDGFSRVHEELEDRLKSLWVQKRRLKRNQPRIFFDGFELDTRTDFKTLDDEYLDQDQPVCALDLNENVVRFINDAPLGLKLNLLSKDLRMSDALDDELADLQEGGELVQSMFRSAQCVSFERPLAKESLNLFELSDRFRYVCVAYVEIELSQTLLDRLSDTLPHLESFSYYPEFFSNHLLNFEFIAKFKSLHYFHVHCCLLSIGELRLIFENCKFIDLLGFEKSNAFIDMLPTCEHEVYTVAWFSKDRIKFATATFGTEELLNYLEASRWVEKNDFLGERKEKEPPLYLGTGPLFDEEEAD